MYVCGLLLIPYVRFRDYYEVLGVPRTATKKDIKNAYFKVGSPHLRSCAEVLKRVFRCS